MQSRNLAFVIEQAQDERQASPIGKAVRESIEVGVVVPSILRTQLVDVGLAVIQDEATAAEFGFKGTTHLKRVLVTDKRGGMVAMGASSDHDDALLHAMLGWFRENPLEGADVPAGLGEVVTS